MHYSPENIKDFYCHDWHILYIVLIFSPESMSVGRWKVIAGKHHVNKKDPQQIIFSVHKIIKHPGYNTDTVANDVALVVLADKIVFSEFMKPVCLPSGENYHVGQYCITAGWGDTQGNFGQGML